MQTEKAIFQDSGIENMLSVSESDMAGGLFKLLYLPFKFRIEPLSRGSIAIRIVPMIPLEKLMVALFQTF